MNSKKLWKSILSISLTAAMLAGCGSTGGDNTGTTISSDQTLQTATEASTETASETASSSKAKTDDVVSESNANVSGTLHFLCGTDDAEAIKTTFAEFQKIYPNTDLDEVIAQDVTDSETLMSTWIASGGFPDMCIQQTGALQQSYMKDGYFVPLDDLGVMDRLVDGDKSLIPYDGKFYQFPLTSAISVTLCNNGVLKDMGIELSADNYPKDMDEFIDLLQQVKDNGVDYPYGIAGADASSCTAWPFQYMYQTLYGEDPNWYADVLSGKKKWNDPEFLEMFTQYDRIRTFVSPDSTGKQNADLQADFIKGDTVFYSQVATSVKSLRELDPELDVICIPSSFTKDAADQTLISGFDKGLSIFSSTGNMDLCKAFMEYITSPEGSTVYINNSGCIPTVKGCEGTIDPAYEIVVAVSQSGTLPNSPILSRQWIAGFKELLKTGCQNWLAGEDAKSVADTIQEGHQRLMDADPEWCQNFLDNYEWK